MWKQLVNLVTILTLTFNSLSHDHEGHHHQNNECYRCHHHRNDNYGSSSGNDDALLILSGVTILTVSTLLLIDLYSKDKNDKKNKKILSLQPDAASFVASEGKVNSVALEQTLTVLRKQYPGTSDIDLAQAILAY